VSLALLVACLGAGHDAQVQTGDSDADVASSLAGSDDAIGPEGGSLADGEGDDGTSSTMPGGAGVPCRYGTESISTIPSVLDLASGQTSRLSVTASIPGGGPPLYTWSADSGVFGDPNAQKTWFRCTQAGDVTVTATADFGACDRQITSVITCSGPPTSGDDGGGDDGDDATVASGGG
jgi:hypothetical protein